MVSVRNTHFHHTAQKDPQKWVTTLGLSRADQNNLLENYETIISLCTKPEQLPLLELGTEMVEILVTLNMDMDTLNAALIFPLLDSHIVTKDQIDELWPKRVVTLVERSRCAAEKQKTNNTHTYIYITFL